ncbi:methyl-accepting chemotaxis protein [Ramlibacter pallidus]|uniref:HAMP domain-containing protein n=1 Tax=Ramlibacter pallidus TaxID=2780087 RepID=A0ABR9S0F7_9BURK|nr:methyl-accepting chemotaxis protein [Ramlibacter pallidus]MBE7366998.1 HAMP domain-containing protein [Ramlibacter pallidus]
MGFFRSRGIAVRMGVGFGVLLALLVGVAGFSAYQLQRQQLQAENLVEEHIGLLDAVGLMQDIALQREMLVRELAFNGDPAAQEETLRKLQANGIRWEGVARRLVTVSELARNERAREASRVVLGVAAKVTALEKPVLGEQATPGTAEAARALAQQVTPHYAELQGMLRAFFSSTKADADLSVADTRADHQRLLKALAGLAGGAVLFGVLVAYFITRGVVRPLAAARGAALQVAQGDLSHEIRWKGSDEIAQLVGSLEWMRMSLAEAVGDIRQAADGVQSGSREIEHGNASLSARTETQAANLEETASSIEELTATVKQNADGAGRASQLARDTTGVARRGGEAVRGVVATMQGIHEASRRIADITGVIDGIAFQTNILALNAAVEAARAGEQGRGFAVVAAEVRSLAQRSAQAAKEIKSLIQDSVARVEGGVQQVDVAGRTIDEIVISATEVDRLIAEIAAASTEQLAGIEQVNSAITQMDGTTQQNAAMVQQAASAAEHLAREADVLVRTVAKFRLAGEAAEGAALASGEERDVAAGGRGVDGQRLFGAEALQIVGPAGLGAGA